ncbi:MAG: universal stress protein [Pseudomonadota bacterium]
MALDYVFVPAIDEKSLEHGLTAALELAREHNGHLSVCHIEQRYPANDVALAYWQASTIRSFEADARAQTEKLGKLFESFCSENNIEIVDPQKPPRKDAVTASWIALLSDPYTEFGHMARSADVSVLCRSSDESEPLTANVRADLLVRSGVPLLNVPAERGYKPAKKILVGWNGTVESKRALTAAMPLIERADTVSLLSAGLKNDGRPTAEHIAAVLRRKGIDATGQDIEGERQPDQQVVAAAQEGGIDLMVIGAYSQPRWRESMFGGMTLRMLNNPPLPVFMVH